MSDLIFEVADNLFEIIAKSKAVVDLLRTTNIQILSKDTLPDVAWLLEDELEQMREQVNRFMPGSAG
jgi:hypothetical protein